MTALLRVCGETFEPREVNGEITIRCEKCEPAEWKRLRFHKLAEQSRERHARRKSS